MSRRPKGWPKGFFYGNGDAFSTPVQMPDPVKAPAHYTWHPSGVDCSAIVEVFSYHVGTAMAYLWRHGHKGTPVQDLEKAREHIEREIKRLKGAEKG